MMNRLAPKYKSSLVSTYFTLVLMLISTSTLLGQKNIADVLKSYEERGNKLYEAGQYEKAIKAFNILLEENRSLVDTKRKLAYAYWEQRNPEKARKWFEELINEDRMDLTPEEHIAYIGTLVSGKHHNKAEKELQKFLEEDPNNQQALRYLESIRNVDQYYEDAWRYKIQNLKLNTHEDDFLAGLYRDSLMILVSGRNNIQRVTKSEEEEIDDLDLFQIPLKSINDLKVEPFGDGKLNTKYPEGPVTFITDYLVVFARSIPSDDSDNGVYRLKLYYSKLIKGKWSKPEVLSLNADGSSSGHPVYDKKTGYLYFSSDRDGGYGGNDLYRSQFSNQKWEEPENLGSPINTSGDEMFPTLKNDSLFYSTDGHGGLGMLDIVVTNIQDTTQSVHNLGVPINSNYDDFNLTWRKTGNRGFFSSNRMGDVWKDEIYSFEYDNTVLQEKSEEPEAIVEEEAPQLEESDIEEIPEDNENYEVSEETVLPESSKVEPVQELLANQISLGTLVFFNFERYSVADHPDNAKRLTSIEQILIDNPTSILEITGHTDYYGGEDYNLELGQKRANAVRDYFVSKGFSEERFVTISKGENQPMSSNESFMGRRLNRRVEFKLTL